jgi:hypothetical protein
MNPVVGAIHELPLPQGLEIETIAYHTCIQQRPVRLNSVDLVRVAVRYGRGSPAHISATRQADFVYLWRFQPPEIINRTVLRDVPLERLYFSVRTIEQNKWKQYKPRLM